MDIQILSCLVKFPKKKIIKKLFEQCLIFNYQQKNLPLSYSTHIIESLQQQVQLTHQQIHQLILTITNLFKIATVLDFNTQKIHNLFNNQLQQGLQQHILELLISFASQIRNIELNRVRQGKMLDLDNLEWNLSLEIANEKGKANIPITQIILPLSQKQDGKVQNLRFQMKGEQFQVFFSNLTKIKSTLNDLISQN